MLATSYKVSLYVSTNNFVYEEFALTLTNGRFEYKFDEMVQLKRPETSGRLFLSCCECLRPMLSSG